MFASVSVWGVVLGALSAMVVGMIWYSPYVFGKQWTKAMGTTDKEMAKRRAAAMPWLLVSSFLTAYVLSLFTVFLHSYVGNSSWLVAGLDTALLAWVGLAGTAVVVHGIFDSRDKILLYINLGNRLATLVVMGLIIGSYLK